MCINLYACKSIVTITNSQFFCFQANGITHHLDDEHCLATFIERISLVWLWDIYYPRSCKRVMYTGSGEWPLSILFFGYLVFPLFAAIMKKHRNRIMLLALATILCRLALLGGYYGIVRALKWLVSLLIQKNPK